jgi:transposase
VAEEALRQIGELYRIEAEVRGRPAEERHEVRQERSKPIVDALHAWLTAQLGRVSGKSALAGAIRYALRHWPGLVLFLDDGRLELDNNTVERAIRPIDIYNRCAITEPLHELRGVQQMVAGHSRSFVALIPLF